MKKSVLAALVFGASMAAQPVVAAYDCNVRTYSHGLGGAKGGRTQAIEVIKSWIPERIIIHDDRLQFGDEAFIAIDSYTTQKIRASYKSEDVNGKLHKVVYEVVFRQNKTVANVTMRQNRNKPLGPVIFDCTEV